MEVLGLTCVTTDLVGITLLGAGVAAFLGLVLYAPTRGVGRTRPPYRLLNETVYVPRRPGESML